MNHTNSKIKSISDEAAMERMNQVAATLAIEGMKQTDDAVRLSYEIAKGLKNANQAAEEIKRKYINAR